MEMLNRAIEDAREFEEFKRRVTTPGVMHIHMSNKDAAFLEQHRFVAKRPGENRQQYRARIYSKE